ncbi:MAG: UDP-N-acetylmuramoyl-L-alanine--D-glutamate ligase [Deltaproteobacteria bacterium]|nr:UDP-N-acetylmuramoyl-L-alanine--D-glutamate ligase [Deltaproteobacteria bacterium]
MSAANPMLQNLGGKDVAVVGAGKTGAAAVRLLQQQGARVHLFDDAPIDKLKDGLAKNGVVTVDAVRLKAGGLDADAIAACGVVVLSPGVPRNHVGLQKALASPTCLVVNELELALASLDPKGIRTCLMVWAITGTNGKSTTTTMAGSIAKERDPQAFIGGNLGTPLCAAVADGLTAGTPDKPRLLVVELSSYQLETLQHFPVHAGAVTNLTPDHLDRYADAAAYYATKARLFALLDTATKGGGITLNAADEESRRVLFPMVKKAHHPCHFDVAVGKPGIEVKPDQLVARPFNVQISLKNPRIVGHHNRQNAAAATALALLSGFTANEIQRGLDAYSGIAHRLERVGEHRGVVWWNDSKATNVDAAVTALKSFDAGVHLIAGGVGKGSSYGPLVDAARGKVVSLYTIGQDAPALGQAFAGVVDVVACRDLETACSKAASRARLGEHIVLSPACASFDQFRDYGHRGERFRALFADARGAL